MRIQDDSWFWRAWDATWPAPMLIAMSVGQTVGLLLGYWINR